MQESRYKNLGRGMGSRYTYLHTRIQSRSYSRYRDLHTRTQSRYISHGTAICSLKCFCQIKWTEVFQTSILFSSFHTPYNPFNSKPPASHRPHFTSKILLSVLQNLYFPHKRQHHHHIGPAGELELVIKFSSDDRIISRVCGQREPMEWTLSEWTQQAGRGYQ